MKKHNLAVIEGGRQDKPVPAVNGDFDLASFLSTEDTIDYNQAFRNVTPDMYGKTIDGVTYGNPTLPLIIYDDKDEFPFSNFEL